MPESETDGNLVRALVRAAAAQSQKSAHDLDAASLEAKARETVSRLDETEKADLSARLRIQGLLTGKDFRREARIATTETAALVQDVARETSRFIEAFLEQNPGEVIESTRSEVGSVLDPERSSRMQALPAAPELLYQEVIGASFDRAKDVAGKPAAKKWIDLVRPVFKQGKAFSLLAELGYIPNELYTNKTFRENVGFTDFSGLHAELKSFETRAKGIERERALQARAQLLTQLFLSDIAPQAQGKVTIDSNGLWINLEKRQGKKVEGRLHAHLPYEYASDELLAAMENQGWLQATEVSEARLRRAEETGDLLMAQSLEEQKIRTFLQRTGRYDCAEYKDQDIDLIMKRMAFDYVVLQHFDDTDRSPSFARFPLSVVRSHLTQEEVKISKAYRLRNVLGLAEAIQSKVSNDVQRKRSGGYGSYDLATSAQDSYEVRKRLLNDPRQYDAPRIVGTLLESLKNGHGDDDVSYQLFRGTIKETDDQTHSFIEIVTEQGGVHRVLLDPGKQLSAHQQQIFESLPELDRSEHELFETLALTYTHYSRVFRNMKELDGPRGDWLSFESLRHAFMEMSQDMNAFLLMEDPVRYAQAFPLYQTFLQKPSHGYLPYAYLELAKAALEDFGAKLFRSDPKHCVADLNTDIQRHEVTFDENFLAEFPDRFKEKPWTSDPVLCAELQDLRQTIAVIDAEDRDIPYVMEAKAIRALRLFRDRPLICVIGGCRDIALDGTEGSAIDTMCNGITEVAHKLKANVVPPGTQSGIGVVFGRASVAYGQRMADLSPAERARFFTVSPGGETYFPGNTHIAPESEKEAMAYAIGPFDSIVTPFQAGWDWSGERKRDAPYFRHVEYAEAIYNRVSAGQPRVTVVGNGGLFTIVEAVAALKNKSSIILVKDTGRFADLAIALRTHSVAPGNDGWPSSVIEMIRNSVPEHSRAALLQAFGSDADHPTAEQQLYREKVLEYAILSKDADVRVSGVAGLQDTVEKVVSDSRAKQALRELSRE